MNDLPRYTWFARFLHWAMALFIIGMLLLGWWMSELPEGPVRSGSIRLHKSIGLTLWVLAVVRLGWRWRHPPPPPAASLSAWQVRASEAVHRTLYGLMLALPTLGYLSASFAGYPMRWFGFKLPSWGWKDPTLNGIFSDLHELTGALLALCLLLHVGGALFHMLIMRDGVSARMGFGVERTQRIE